MNRHRPAAALAASSFLLLAAGVAAAAAPAAAPAAMDDAARMNYALGYQLGRDLAGTELRMDALGQGLQDGRSGAAPRLTPAELEAALVALQANVSAQRAKAQAEQMDKAAAAGTAYLAANGKKAGVVTTQSGLQYRIVTPGSGPQPKAGDTVTVHYRGTLVDGTEFDSSYGGNPVSFPLRGLIPAWQLAIPQAGVGDTIEIAVPSDLGYGPKGAGPIPGGATLLFKIELLGIEG